MDQNYKKWLEIIFWQSADLYINLEVNLGHKYFKATMFQVRKFFIAKSTMRDVCAETTPNTQWEKTSEQNW